MFGFDNIILQRVGFKCNFFCKIMLGWILPPQRILYNLCLIKDSEEKTIKNISLLLNEYNKYNKLTDYELECFTTFYELANAMHIMCTLYISKTDGESEENNYWYNEGMVGLSYSDKIDIELFHKNNF